MSNKKSDHELSVFLEFAKAAKLAGDHARAECRNDPEPDIYYPESGTPCYFELGRLADNAFAKQVIKAIRHAPAQVATNTAKVGYPQRDMLNQKLQKPTPLPGCRSTWFFTTISMHLG